MKKTAQAFVGTWRITEMDVWDADYFDMEEREMGQTPVLPELLHLSFRVRCHEPDIFRWDSICDASPWAL